MSILNQNIVCDISAKCGNCRKDSLEKEDAQCGPNKNAKQKKPNPHTLPTFQKVFFSFVHIRFFFFLVGFLDAFDNCIIHCEKIKADTQ